jgi:tetratricopeptide (TPR) repeat protein
MIEEALTLVPDDSHAAGRLLATHGWFVGIAEGDGERADTAFEQALEIAQRYDDLALERRTLANAAWVDVWHFRWRDGISKGLEAIELARRDADEHTEILALRCLVWAHTAAGEREQARSHSVQSLAVAEKLRERWWLASASFDSARLSHYEGDWQAARQMSAVSLNAEPWDPRPLSIQAALDYELGDFDVGAASLGRLENAVERFPPPGPIAEHYFAAGLIPLICRITGTDAGIQKAKAGARSLLAMPRVAPALAMTARSGLALVAERDGDVRTAEELYADLEPQRGTASFFIPFTVDRLLGSLARTAGRRDTAVVHFEEGLAFCERAGYRPEYAWTASDYAEALLERGSRADQEHAGRLQRNAIEIAGELGMHPLMKRVRSRGNLTEVKREDGERPG